MSRIAIRCTIATLALFTSILALNPHARAADGPMTLPSVEIACTASVPAICCATPGQLVRGANCVDYGCNGLGTCVNTEDGALCMPVQVRMTPAAPLGRRPSPEITDEASAFQSIELPPGAILQPRGGCAVTSCRTGSRCMELAENGELHIMCMSIFEISTF